MFFTEQERAIYTAPYGRKYDPLRVLHLLTVVSGNQLSTWVKLRNPETMESGDVSVSGRAEAAVNAANAELKLADCARQVFGFGSFEESGITDAVVLETLYHYLGYLEGKESTARTPQSMPVTEFELRQGIMGTSLPSA